MNPVLCISRIALPPVDSDQIVSFNGDLDPNHIHFLNRSLADAKDEKLFAIAKEYPQLLPYVIVTCGDEFLTYARRGTEDRLHGKRSLGFGGHVEVSDVTQVKSVYDLTDCAKRELEEELGLKDANVYISNDLIFSNYDNVSKVHVGVLGYCEIDKSLIKPDGLEIIDPQWQTQSDIRARLDNYERWSQLVIKHY